MNLSKKFILKKIILILGAFTIAFSIALSFHSQYLESIGVDPKEFISMRANANLMSNEHKEIAQYMCSLSEPNSDCINYRINESKKINQVRKPNKQIKKHEHSPNTDYLFNGLNKNGNLENSIMKLNMIESMDFIPRNEN